MVFQNNTYTLYNKDVPILTFHCERKENKDTYFVVDEYLSKSTPFGFKDINSWIENRRAPKHRKHIKEILDKCGCNDLEGFIRFTYCAGLNDTFWVKPDERVLFWKDVSLYRNEFDENIARIAFDGGLMGEIFSSASPELATDGTFPKCWIRKDNNIFLLKQGSEACKLSVYSEQYAYELAKIICDDALYYEIVKHHGKLAAKCPLFTSEKISYAPISAVLGENASFDTISDFYDSIGEGKKFRQMMILDALTINTDRHLKNFGILYDADTKDILGMAPIFDNNLSMCPQATMSDLEDIQKYMRSRSCAFEEGFNEIAFKCIEKDPELRGKLVALKDFRFREDYKYHLPPARVALLNQMLQTQINNILEHRVISPQYDKPEKVTIENLYIELKKSDISDDLYQLLKSEDFKISDFSVETDTGNNFSVSNSQYCVNEDGDNITIEIFDSDVKGYSDSLRATAINGLTIINDELGKTVILPIHRMEIELSIQNETHVSTIRNARILALLSSHTENAKEIISAYEKSKVASKSH